MRTSKQVNLDWFKVPEKFDDVYKIMEQIGFVNFPYSGFPLFLPLGQKIMGNICRVIKEEAENNHFSEVYLPLVQHEHNFQKSGRDKIFNNEFMRLSGKREGFLLTPTNEEFILEFVSRNIQSYRQLPIRYFQIADKFREVLKPKGLMRSSQFLMADMCSIDADEASLKESSSLFETMAKRLFERLGIKTFRLEKNNGGYVDYVFPCDDGETNIIIGPKGDTARYAHKGDTSSNKASSLGMYFIFDRLNFFNVTYTNGEGNQRPIKLGTYGFGIQRCFHAAVSQNRDDFGISLPKEIKPFEFSIIPIDPKNSYHEAYSKEIYNAFRKVNKDVLLDDRVASIMERAKYADFIGINHKIFIGDSEIKSRDLTVKARGSKNGNRVSLDCILSKDL